MTSQNASLEYHAPYTHVLVDHMVYSCVVTATVITTIGCALVYVPNQSFE